MEKVLRCLGNTFLYLAHGVGEAKNAVKSYLFDLIFADDHINQ
jgi:hypothetical protein